MIYDLAVIGAALLIVRGLGLSSFLPWKKTNDSFSKGGNLVDLDKWYAGRNKVQHIIGWMLLAWIFKHISDNFTVVTLFGLGTALAWEYYEYWDYKKWVAKGSPSPQPIATDLPSWRDMIASLIGTWIGYIL